jgi:hypothetical protein
MSGGAGAAYAVSGDYHRVSFSGRNTLDVARTGSSSFFAAGAYSEVGTANVNGTIGAFTDGGTYSVGSFGAFAWIDTGPSTFSGGALVGGALAVSSALSGGTDPTAVFDVRKGGGTFTNATIAGTYFVVGYGWAPGPGSYNYSFNGTLIPDGSGAWTSSATVNVSGTVVTGNTNSGTYTVGADGALSVTDAFSVVAQGGVLAGGDVLILSTVTSTKQPEISIAIRKAGSFTTSSVAGQYHVVHFGSTSAAVASHYCISSTATFDGLGNLTWSGTQNYEGGISSMATIAETCSIAADGMLTISNPAPMSYTGGVLAGGNVLIAACISGSGVAEFRVYLRI